ncbi:hypothetical protein HYV50_02950 [Candidatus Pacearchaeota archaeon]|nr:hypothetical protein [Candidatus Pacearchaeota archaeon]
MKKKSQSAIEFMILIGGVLFFFLTILFVFQQDIADKTIQKRNYAFQKTANDIKNEIDLASKATDGYQRQFFVPERISGMQYEVNITQNLIYIRTLNNEYAAAYPVQNITGDIIKGTNLIKKENGVVRLNS